jgi:hypothetical protein
MLLSLQLGTGLPLAVPLDWHSDGQQVLPVLFKVAQCWVLSLTF